MRTGIGSPPDDTRLNRVAISVLLAIQACVAALLGGMWLYTLVIDAEFHHYLPIDYLPSVVVLGLGIAFAGCAILVTRRASSASVVITVTQVIAMVVGVYSLARGVEAGMIPLVLGFFVFVTLYRQMGSE